MSSIRSALVVGAGLAGTAAAILLARGGVAVDVIDVKPEITALGSGITVQGNALRVLRQLGVWEGVREAGYTFDALGLRAPDAHGTLLALIPDARTGGDDLPSTMGIDRRELARILVDAAATAGAKVRFATSVETLAQDEHGVDVTFSDGSASRYDLVIGADGVRSATRALVGVDLTPTPTGMGIWRIFCSRPASVTRTDLVYGGRCYIAGYCPTGEDSAYAYLVEDATDRSQLSPQEQLDVVVDLAGAYHGPWDEIRERLVDPAQINYTRFEAHVLPRPWNRGRVVLIGDAAHTCPPTLAQGGALALEDAVVLAELLLAAPVLDERVWDDFGDRRHERARAVVDASVQLGQWMLDHDAGADVPGLMGRISAIVTRPA